MPKSMRVILAVLLLAIPVAWWGLRAAFEEPSAPAKATAPARPVPSSTSIPRGPASEKDAPDEDLEEAEAEAEDEYTDEDELEELLEDDEADLAGPGPCIQIEVTARGVPVPDARVDAVRRDEDSYFSLSPIRVGPEGRRQAWCMPGNYLLGARAPGFASSFMELVVAAGGAPPLARFQLDAGITLSGVVLDKDSQGPVSQARVTLSRNDDYLPFAKEASATSDGRGIFHVSALTEGAYSLEVEAPGHSSLSTEVMVPRAETLTLELDGTARLEGQVVDGAGAPVPGAQVEAIGSGEVGGGDEDTPLRTDAQGRFSIEVEEGTWRVTARHNGQAGQHEGAVTVARGGLVDGLIIPLRPGGTVSGTVVARTTQEPIQEAYVSMRNTASGWDASTRTDESGRFRLEQLIPGPYILLISKSGYPQDQREDLRVESGQELSVQIALTRQARVKGTVTDAMGRPAEDGLVYAQLLGELESPQKRTGASVNEKGHYSLGPLLPGSYRLEAQLTDTSKLITRELTLAEGETAQVDFALPDAQGQVEGVVQREGGGRPAWPVDVTVTSGPQEPWIDPDEETGQFTARLLPGVYELTASYSGTEEGGPAKSVTVEAGKTSRVTLTVPGTLIETSGTVLNARGEPVGTASVSLSSEDDEVYASTETDARGRFTLRTAQGTAGTPVSITADQGAEQGEVQNVRVGSHEVVVRLGRAAALRGRVIAARGSPIQGFSLDMGQEDEGFAPNFAAEGASPFLGDTFEVVDEPPGSYYVLVRTSDGRSGMAQVKLVSGQTSTVEVSVGLLATITGRIRNEGLAPDHRVDQVVLDGDTPRERVANVSEVGRFELLPIEPGEHSLTLGDHQTISVRVREGQTLELGELVPVEASATPTPP